MKYLATGNFVVDELHKDAGIFVSAGGPVRYAYGGIRLFTDDCKPVANVGADIDTYLSAWNTEDHIQTDGFMVRSDFTTKILLQYIDEERYTYEYAIGAWLGAINFGMLRIRPDDLLPHLDGVEGIYIDQPIDTAFWERMQALRARYGFSIMWEVQYETNKELHYQKRMRREQLFSLLCYVDMFSMNLNECKELFETNEEEEVFRILLSLKTPMFLRAGARGSYWIEDGVATFVPSIPTDTVLDTMGCGNCSTGAAMLMRCRGKTPYEICVAANVAAAFNLRQFGAISGFTKDQRMEAMKLCEQYGPHPES